ncbi:MAG TPA: hypothetical protein VGE39_23480, partial [Prosthecobacter sp.]
TTTAFPAVPDILAQWFKPGAAEHLRCSRVTDREFRVEILDAPPTQIPGPLAMMGYARQFSQETTCDTDEIMRELREGEAD